MTTPTPRAQAAHFFLETLRALDIPRRIHALVQATPTTLTIDHQTYDLTRLTRIQIIAIGKAATPMAEALIDLLPTPNIHGILVSPTPPKSPLPNITLYPASHPLPTQSSLDAAQAILHLLSTADSNTLVLYLISGGASAMIEQPLNPHFTLADTIALNRALVHSGLPIAQMNTLRKHFSAVKGGRLALAAAPATKVTLLISDVPPNQLDIIASGPSLPDPTTTEDCRQILANPNLHLPENLRQYFLDPQLPETPKSTHPAFRNAQALSLLSSEDLTREAALLATRAGYHVEIDNTCDDHDHRQAATYLLSRLQALRKQHPHTCLLSAGELSVKLPPIHGSGGRNQQFTLECARQIAANPQPIAVLSCGSDGADGNSPAAGAVADQTTWQRALDQNLNPAEALETFNAHPLFQALGDTIQTGPTANNLRDLRILLANP
jgi:glycerate 2-kinase